MAFMVDVLIRVDVLGNDGEEVISHINLGKTELWPYIQEGMVAEVDGDDYIVSNVKLSERRKARGRRGWMDRITTCDLTRVGGNLKMNAGELKDYVARKCMFKWNIVDGAHNISPKFPYRNIVMFLTALTKGDSYLIVTSDGHEVLVKPRAAQTYTEMTFNSMIDALEVLKERHGNGEI